MDQRQRIAAQRAMAREAIGKLRAVLELFGTEDGAVAGDDPGYEDFLARVDEIEDWVFGESAIA